jgi:RHS repeat-associated protein
VRAESITQTIIYTYTSGGLRVGQNVDGVETTFVWDWASGLPEMLSEGGNLYLVGHETLGQWDGDEWAYYLPDALGSVRQVTDETGAVTAAREWTPYRVEVGGAQAGLGYTGEWGDTALGMTYLRARWYDSYLNQFVSPDPIVPDYRNPQSINSYTYALGNPTNWLDPSGLCAVTGTTDCEKFVSEIRCMIEGVREAQKCRPIVGALAGEEGLVLLRHPIHGLALLFAVDSSRNNQSTRRSRSMASAKMVYAGRPECIRMGSSCKSARI